MKLRWLERNGEKVLQQEAIANGEVIWADVPTVQEPRKAREWDVPIDSKGVLWPSRAAGMSPKMIRVREILPGEVNG